MNQREVWDNIAKPWKEFRTLVPPTVKKFLEGKKGKIIDIGCGSGRNILGIEGLEWSGIDFSEKMIELAREFCNEKDIECDLNVASVENLPFEDETFDYGLYYAVIHCVDSSNKREESLRELYRVLKKGGEALISAWGPKSPRLKNKEKECFVPWNLKEKRISEKRYTYVFELKELEELCKKVGFEIVKSWEERNVNVVVKKN